jgi:hypothetical protein
MFVRAISVLALLCALSIPAASQSPLDRFRRNIPKVNDSNKTVSDQSEYNSPARSEIDGVKTVLSNLRIRFKSQKWSDENYVRQIAEYIRKAETYIAQIREKDPKWNVTSYENELRPYKSAYSEKGAALAAKDSYIDQARRMVSATATFPNYKNKLQFSNKSDIENYHKAAKELDYPAGSAKLREGVSKFSDLASDDNIKYLLHEFPAEFSALANQFLSESNRFTELAYQAQTNNKVRAVEYAEISLLLTDIVALVTPDHANVVAAKKDAETAMNKIGGALAAASYTSDFHKSNAGKIVFFSSPPAIKQENAAKVSSAFKAGDHIYAMVYLKAALKDLASISSRDYLDGIEYKLFIDGTEVTGTDRFLAKLTWEQYKDPATTYLKLDIVPDPDVIDYPSPFQYDPVINFTRAFGRSSPRRHTIEIRFTAGSVAHATGSFEIETSNGQEKLLAIADSLHKEKISKVFLPKPKMVSDALQQSMAQALKSNRWNQEMLRVVITDSAWEIHRNAFGAIIFRSIGAAVAMKEPDGRCRYFTLSFKQAYQGGGYGRTEQHGVGNNYEMACANVNK